MSHIVASIPCSGVQDRGYTFLYVLGRPFGRYDCVRAVSMKNASVDIGFEQLLQLNLVPPIFSLLVLSWVLNL